MGPDRPFLRGSENASCTAVYPSFSLVVPWAMKQGPALITVTGTARASSKIWVIPSFSPKIPLTSAIGSGPRSLQLDLDVHAGRQLEPLQLLHRLGRGVQDVDEPLVREHLEVLAAVLVLVRATDHRVQRSLGRQRYRPHDLRPGPEDVINDLPRRLVQDLVVVRPQLDPDPRRRHQTSPLAPTERLT